MATHTWENCHADRPHAFGSKKDYWSFYFLDPSWPRQGEQAINVGDRIVFADGTFVVKGIELRTPDPDQGGFGDEAGVLLRLAPQQS